MKTLTFQRKGRTLEVRMDRNHKSFVCHVWDGEKQASSVPYTVSEAEVEAAEARGDLGRVLDAALADVRSAVIEGRLEV
jgi:hypothetical protein